MINSMERMYRTHHECKRTGSCLNAGTVKCVDCVVGNEPEGWIMHSHYASLKMVSATIEGTFYPVISGWFWSIHGLVSRNTYLGKDGDTVYIDGSKYFKVILPPNRQITIKPID